MLKYLAFLFPLTCHAALPFVDLASVPPPAAGSPLLKLKTSTTSPRLDTSNAKIRPVCRFAKAGTFDPIVGPGQAIFGHHHTFFGNTSITGLSTSTQIANTGNSTCTGGIALRSGIWIPSMVDKITGRFITPWQNIVYYFSGYTVAARMATNPVPEGLRMMTGDSKNQTLSSELQVKKKILFECYNPFTANSHHAYGFTIPNCPTGESVRMSISFPNCWNGKDLDSADHRSHMTFSKPNLLSRPNECPVSHPVRIADISFHIDYKVDPGMSSANWVLASDDLTANLPGASAHADYMTGIDRHVMNLFTTNCLQTAHDCGNNLLGIDPKDNLLKALY